MKDYHANVIQDGEDLLLTFPPEMMEELGWKTGDTLEWIDNGGFYTLRKKVIDNDDK